MGDDDEEMEEVQEAQLEMSRDLLIKCAGLWDIENTRQQELRRLADASTHENRLRVQQERARTWDMTAIMEYHMGNLFESTHGAIYWALRNNSKMKALKFRIVGQGTSVSPEDMRKDLQYVKDILNASGQDEIKWIFIQDQYDFWNSLSDEELYAI